MSQAASPLDVVNARMAAHNQHDMDRFLNTYADEIQVYDYPNTPLGSPGKAHIKSIFEPLFAEYAVHVEIHHQIVNGNYVVNQETVTRQGEIFEYVSIYEVKDGLIQNVRFIKE